VSASVHRCIALLAAGLLWGCQIISGLDGLQVGESSLRDAGRRSDAIGCEDGGVAAQCSGSGPAADAGQRCEAGESDPACACAPGSAGAPCDLVAQCGCGVGESCQYRSGGTGCFPSGSAALGASCSADPDCTTGACVAGLCERYCASDADCADGLCRALPASGDAKACLRRCDFASGAPCEQPAECVRFSAGAPGAPAPPGDYCAIPVSECVTDQRCDEPAWGTRRCAAGSDAVDCACVSGVPGASCDLITQCGCAPGSHCALSAPEGAAPSVSCIDDRSVTREPGGRCNDESECPAGHSCWRGLCEQYCVNDAQCASGKCLALSTSGELLGLRVCTIACTFDSELECGTGARCVHAPDAVDYCLIPRSPCPYEGDGVCDGPTGTRICSEGTDLADCG
jgi:hypothetical protein